jgi:low temperature requirement protein LtrA
VPTKAGIIAVAADELIGAHPAVQGTLASAALTLGGTRPFVAAQAFFQVGRVRVAALVALAALIASASAGFAIPALALSGAAGSTIAGLAMWETFD